MTIAIPGIWNPGIGNSGGEFERGGSTEGLQKAFQDTR